MAFGAWLDHQPGWLRGADEPFGPVLAGIVLRQGAERTRGEDEARSRLTASVPVAELVGPLGPLGAAGDLLDQRYGVHSERVGVDPYGTAATP